MPDWNNARIMHRFYGIMHSETDYPKVCNEKQTEYINDKADSIVCAIRFCSY